MELFADNAPIILLVFITILFALIFLVGEQHYQKYIIVFLASFCSIIWGISDSGLFLSNNKIYGTIANAFAIFVTIFGAISIIKQWKDNIEKKAQEDLVLKNTLIEKIMKELNDYIKERGEKLSQYILVKEVEETQQIKSENNLINTIFIDTNRVNIEYAEKIEKCLLGIVIPLNTLENTDEQYYEKLKILLKEVKLVIVPHFQKSEGSNSWLNNRIRFYAKLMITDKVIIYTNQEISEPLRKIELIKPKSSEFNCEDLKVAIEKKLGRDYV